MQVILREDVPELGIIGDVVEVKPGYARNYLIPRGMAVPADRRNLRQLEHDKRIIEVKKQRERGTYERLASQLGALKLETEVRAGRRGRLFGSMCISCWPTRVSKSIDDESSCESRSRRSASSR
jgi:large subunit ribosomal protein L9